MLTIRFARTGRRNRAQFQIVLQEHTVAPGGRHVEILGSHDPHLKKTVLKEDRIKYWAGQGVQMSDTAFNLFLSKGVITGEKRKVKMPKKIEAPLAEQAVEVVAEPVIAEEAKPEVVAEAPVEEKKEEVKEEVKAE
jgi:small subunit ribosomal protein S16